MMFKALAEFVMRGRLQAIAVALVTSWFPILPQASFGLVALRKGWQEGLIVAAVATLPAGLGLLLGKTAAALVYASIAVHVVNYVVCLVLRSTISWPQTLLVCVCFSALSSWLVVAMSGDIVTDFRAFMTDLLTGPNANTALSDENTQKLVDIWVGSRAKCSALIAYWICAASILGLVMARWWQAMLYNPGGFREEFHQVRLPVAMAGGCITAVLFALIKTEYWLWAGLLGLPLVTAGFGFMHWLIARFRLGTPAVILLYLLVPLLKIGALLLMLLAVVDSALNLRKIIGSNQGTKAD